MEQANRWSNPLGRTKGVFYGWWMVGFGALVMALSNVPLFQGTTVWNPVLKGHFGWSSAQVTWGFALTRVEGSLTGPLTGYLIDKLGSRRMVFVGLLVQGIGLVLFSRIHSLWEFYLAYLIMSVGSGLGAFLPIMTTLNHWFYRRRATAVALAMEGMVIGGITLVPVLAWAIDPDEPDRFGWRTTASAIGVLTMLVAWPLSRLIRNRPEDYGQHPDGRRPAILTGGNPGVQGPEEVEPSYTWQEALKTRTFWFMNIGHACVSMVVHTVAVHLGILLDDRGFSLQTIGWIVSAYLAVGAVSTLVGGYVGDRLSMRVGIFVFAAMQTLGIFVLILFHGEPAAFLFAVLFGIGFGGRVPLTIAIRSAYFGRKAFASITGLSQIPVNVMLLAAPVYAAYLFDITGKYDIPFLTIAVVSLLGATLYLMLGEPIRLASQSPQRAKDTE